jgi:hypothetical protein
MRLLVAVLPLIAMCVPTMASPTPQRLALLEAAIQPSASMGELVSLRDAECRYSGQLVREPSNAKGFAASVAEAAGADTGRWHIHISRRTCGQQTESVQMRAYLPKPPSLAGGGGFPAQPYGYEAGTKFTLLPKN